MSNKKKIRGWLILGVLLPLTVILLYFFFIQSLVIQAFENKSPTWFNQVINYLYPRFWVEKYRFSLDFFLQKTSQIVIRFTLVIWVISAFFISSLRSQKFKNRISNFWNATTTINDINTIKYALIIILGLFTWDWLYIFSDLSKSKVFFEPVFLLKVFHLPFPSVSIIYSMIILMWASALVLIVGIHRLEAVISSILAICFICLQAYMFSFHKLDHTFATYTYVLLLLPFMIYEKNKSKISKRHSVNAWALQLSKTMICLTYFFSGFEKLLISGFSWLNANNLQSHALNHNVHFGIWITQSDFVSSSMLVLVLVWELSFPLVLFFSKLKAPILIFGIVFHISTFLLFNIGGWYSPWWLLYIVFLVKTRLSNG